MTLVSMSTIELLRISKRTCVANENIVVDICIMKILKFKFLGCNVIQSTQWRELNECINHRNSTLFKM